MNRFISQFGRPAGAFGRMLGRVMTISNRKMHRAVMSELGSFSELLEIGFGTGSQLEMISRSFPEARLSGIDISEDMLKAAGKRLGIRAELFLCSCESTAFADSRFDAVITTDTCYFWKDAQAVLAEVSRITKPEGRLIIAYNSIYAGSVHKSEGTAMYNDQTIAAELDKAGMKLISKRSCGYKQTVFVIRNRK